MPIFKRLEHLAARLVQVFRRAVRQANSALKLSKVEEADINTPLYYILGRDIGPRDLDAAHFAFTITPCATGVVCRHEDKTLIEPFVFQVLQAIDEAACCDLAAHLARATRCPTLTVGEGKEMTAVFHDGRKETICLSLLSL